MENKPSCEAAVTTALQNSTSTDLVRQWYYYMAIFNVYIDGGESMGPQPNKKTVVNLTYLPTHIQILTALGPQIITNFPNLFNSSRGQMFLQRFGYTPEQTKEAGGVYSYTLNIKIFTPILNYLNEINTKIYLPAPNKNVYMDISSIPNIPDIEKITKDITKMLTVLSFPIPINLENEKLGAPTPAPIITAGKSSFGKSSFGEMGGISWFFVILLISLVIYYSFFHFYKKQPVPLPEFLKKIEFVKKYTSFGKSRR